jgi:Flp pilus assembly pilin Flp
MLCELQKFLKDEAGAEFIEWAAVVIILLMAVLVALRAVGVELTATYEDIKAWIQCARTGNCP